MFSTDGNLKSCSKCKAMKPLAQFNKRSALRSRLSAWCRDCAQEAALIFYGKTKKRQAINRLKRIYGLSDEQIAHWERNALGPCALCHRPETVNKNGCLSVDHDHVTGKIRGLLCHECNTTRFPDDVNRLRARVAYLEYHSGSAATADTSWLLF